MMTVRESGHYWIRVDGKGEAEIGLWHPNEFWLTIGDDGQGVDAARVEVLSQKLVLLESSGASLAEILKKPFEEVNETDWKILRDEFIARVLKGGGAQGPFTGANPFMVVGPLDTLNRFGITANGSSVVMQGRPPAVMQTTTAIELAAWLLMGAELAGHGAVIEVVAKTLEAIRAT